MKPNPTTTNTRPGVEHARDGLAGALKEAHQEIIDLRMRLAEYEWVEAALQNRTRELSERVKELECLFFISHCLCRRDADLPKLLQRIADELPKGFQCPHQTWVSLDCAGGRYRSQGFRTTTDAYGVDIATQGQVVGELRVFVKPGAAGDAPSIMPMEKTLIDTVALWIESTVAHWHETDRRRPSANWWERLKAAIGHNPRRP